jgi:hypothetical protein
VKVILMFRSILIFLKKLLNINKTYARKVDGLLNTLKFVQKMSADVIKFICISVVKQVHKLRRLRFIHVYNASYQRGCPVFVLVPMRHVLRIEQRLKINCTSKCYVRYIRTFFACLTKLRKLHIFCDF